MLDFFHILEEVNPNDPSIVMTVLEGEAFGEKALVSKHKLVWESRKGGYYMQHQEEIERIHDSRVVVIGGNKIFCELLGHKKKLVICGGGHVSIPLIQMGRMIGCKVTVLEDRPKFADHARCAGAEEVFCEPFEDGLKKIEGDGDTFFVIVTRGHRYDQTCLELIAQKKHAYIGMIGSRRRTGMVKEAIIAKGADPEVIGRVYTPIGLDIGAETPEEIAVAIMAEIIEVKNKKSKSNLGYSKEIIQAALGGTGSQKMTGSQTASSQAPDNESECHKDHKVLATIVARKGSAPRGVGTKMLILPDGNCVGTIGGGCVEADIIQKALLMSRRGESQPRLYHVDITGRDVENEGMLCGGVLDILLEVVR